MGDEYILSSIEVKYKWKIVGVIYILNLIYLFYLKMNICRSS